MRDLREFKENVTSHWTNPGTEGPAISTSTTIHRITSSGRDDAKATSPNGEGAYFLPTTYRGWYYGSTSYEHDYKASSTGTSLPRRHYGRYTWSAYSTGMNTSTLYGCDTSNRPAVPGWLTSKVEARLNARIKEQNWNIGQFLAELPESILFITEMVKDMISILSAVKARRFKDYVIARGPRRYYDKLGKNSLPSYWKMDPKKLGRHRPNRDYDVRALHRNRSISKIQAAKSASSAYLAVMYGLMPLLNDIYQMAIFLEEGVKTLDKQVFSVDASGTEPIPAPQLSAGTYDMGSSWKGEWGVKAEVNFRVKHPWLTTLESLGLLSPLDLAWELLPLSFVVDWFLPVGAFVSAFSGHWGLAFSHGYRTSYAKWNADVAFSKGAVFRSGTPGRLTGRLLSFNRQQYLTFPIPVPYVKGLDDILGLGLSRNLSLLALAVQRTL